jgi:peptidoglycan hydrolase-like protein with peptidoglycan-binding domain
MPSFPGPSGWRGFAFAAVFLGCASAALAAQPANPPPPPASATDQVFESQKAAFEALSETDRRAIQDALIWTGDYNGVVDGSFGKRTRDSILAYQANAKSPTTGILEASQLAALAAAAEKAKAAVKFQVVSDDKSGIKIGAPLKLMDKRAGIASGSRLMSADGAIMLDLASLGGADANLATLYARLTADAPGRKVTLKLSRPDFFVVSGEEGGRKFYARYAKAPAGWPDPSLIRSFTLSYPIAATNFDRLGVAIANSFEPFSAASAVGSVAASPSKPAAAVPPKPTLVASGFVVAAGEALTAIDSSLCPHPSVDGKPAKFLREDKQSGLSLIGASFAQNAPAGAPVLGPLGDDLVALTYSADDAGDKPVLDVATISPLAQTKDDARPLLLASLPQNAAGSPVFDRKGALVAIVARPAGEAKTIAGVTPLAPHGVISASEIERFLTGADVAIAKGTDEAAGAAGRIVADKGALVVPILCN